MHELKTSCQYLLGFTRFNWGDAS